MNSSYENSGLLSKSSRWLEEAIPGRVVLLRALPGLGDMLCIVPALRALRGALPEAQITLIGLPWAQSFVQRFKAYLDDFLEFPGYPGLPERSPSIWQLPSFLAEVQARFFDLAVQMHGSGLVTNPFIALLGARRTAGFFLPGQYCPDKNYFLPYPMHEPEVRRYLHLLEFLGIPAQGEALEFPLDEADWQDLFAIEEARALRSGEYVCLHPGASRFDRCWPPEQFAAVADALAARGWQPVLTGTAREIKLTQAVSQVMKTRPVDLAGRTSLGALAALMSQARLVVCNDTGVSHLAAALQVPSVVIFPKSHPDRWAPLDQERHHIVCHLPEDHPYQRFMASRQSFCLGEGCLALAQVWQESPPAYISVDLVMSHVENLLTQKKGEY